MLVRGERAEEVDDVELKERLGIDGVADEAKAGTVREKEKESGVGEESENVVGDPGQVFVMEAGRGERRHVLREAAESREAVLEADVLSDDGKYGGRQSLEVAERRAGEERGRRAGGRAAGHGSAAAECWVKVRLVRAGARIMRVAIGVL